MDKELLDGNSKANWGLGDHYNGRRINTSLMTLSVQPERTDARVGLSRQGQAVRIGLWSKSGAHRQWLVLAGWLLWKRTGV
jgi:hypothetical protein